MLIFLSMLNTDEERDLFERLYTEHRSGMFRIARSYLPSDADAEDIVHDVFLEVADRRMDKLMTRDDAARKRFLFLITKHRSISLLRSRSFLISLDSLPPDAADRLPGMTDGDFLNALVTRSVAGCVEEAIRGLDPIYREVLWLRFHMELTVHEIAESLGEKESTVYKRLERGKKKLLADVRAA